MNIQEIKTINETSCPYEISDLPSHDRPSQRLATHGAECLSNRDLITIITGNLSVADRLTVAFDGNIDLLAQATIEELSAVKGIGVAKATQIRAMFALSSRKGCNLLPDKLNAPSLVADYLYSFFQGKKQEEVRVVLLDTRNQLISNRLVTRGTLTASQVHPREVFRPAIREAAARIILAHNHPSGDPSPSKQDIEVTNKIYESGETIGIPLVDHVIIGDKSNGLDNFYTSLRRLGHCG